jgi:type IX secretion system PorP/SprF family membrane protein
VINPAITGIENYVDIKASHRLQWVGLLDAPVTTYFTMHGPIGKSDYKATPTSYKVPGENPRGSKYWQEYTVSEPHHGWGVQIVNDRTGPLNNFSAMATYAYHLGLSPRTNLAAGIGAGISSISLNADKLQFYNSSVDPAVFNNSLINRTKLDINVGLYLYSDDYFVGLSAQQVAPSKLNFSNNTLQQIEGKSVPHFFAHAGYRFMMGDNFNVIPSVMLKYVQPTPLQVEVNAKLQYQDLIWVGAGYRHEDGATAMVGFNVSNTFNIGYSYDYITSRLNTFTRGTHEIMIGFTLGNKYGDTCPRNVW